MTCGKVERKVNDGQATFSARQAIAVQEEMRRSLKLEPEEQFPLPAFIGMISDEIDQFRHSGHSDAEIVALIKSTIGRDINLADIERFYAPPQSRYAGDPPN